MQTHLPTLIRALLEPARYPGAVHQVTLVQTHISWVLLAGEFAYKIKKPLKLPFLDFSTLELRHTCCQDELRLNCRFAPDIYLDVVAIVGSPDGTVLELIGRPDCALNPSGLAYFGPLRARPGAFSGPFLRRPMAFENPIPRWPVTTVVRGLLVLPSMIPEAGPISNPSALPVAR